MDNTLFAIITTGGKQYRVHEGDELLIDQLEKNEKKQIEFKPLLVVGKNNLKIGNPNVEDMKVVGTVLDNEQGKKIHILTYKQKTRYRRKIGFRSKLTRIKIEQISSEKNSKEEIKKSKEKKASKTKLASKKKTEKKKIKEKTK